MDLHERLEHIRALQHSNTEDVSEVVPASAPSISGTQNPPLDALVHGVWREREGCRCLTSEYVLSLTHLHGQLSLGALLDIPAHAWTPFIAGLDDGAIEPRDLLFFDIETTGLARGAGTYAFMVGLGSFIDDAFCVRQYLMPDYDSEPALLSLLDDELAGCSGLVSFNGRTFDWPILQARYVLAQHPLPFSGEPHLDLLSLSRRLWRRMLPSCALSSLEANILAVQRKGEDVPGYLIPALYHDYVRYGHTRPMARVFYHNLVDILSMVVLAARVGVLLTAPESQEVQPYCDDFALGRLYEHLGDIDAAIAAYRRAGDAAAEPLALLLKRLGRHEEAMAVWRARLGCGEVYPYVELAKQYEHRLRDLEGARAIVLAAMAHLAQLSDSSSSRDARRDLHHRLARLERRLKSG